MQNPPEKRVALVTGGARRVGAAIVEKLAFEGFDVAFTFNESAEAARLLCDRITLETQSRCLAIKADLFQSDVAGTAIKMNFSGWSERLDLLVNNASTFITGDLQSTSVSDLRKAAALHVEAPFILTQSFEKFLRASRGHIVNMSDLLAEKPWPEYLAHCASKAALSNLTLGLARFLAPDVTVNAIAPGVVEWPKGYNEDAKEKYLKRVPLARAGTPQDVANLVHFLATEGSYITGQIIRLDGGRSIT